MEFPQPAESVFLDLSARAKLRFTGADRMRFLNGQVSNDVRRATADTSVYTGVMTIKGKLSGDAFIHAGDDFLLLDAEGELREALAARLERYLIADDVQIEDVTDGLGLFHVLDYAGVMEEAHTLTGLDPDVRAIHGWRFGRMGTDLFFPTTLEKEIRERLHAAGISLLNEDAVESLRILNGVPRWGAELDENTMPAEAGIEERAVSYCQRLLHRPGGRLTRQKRGSRQPSASRVACAGRFAFIRWHDPLARRCAARNQGGGTDHERGTLGGPRRGGFRGAGLRPARVGNPRHPARRRAPAATCRSFRRSRSRRLRRNTSLPRGSLRPAFFLR